MFRNKLQPLRALALKNPPRMRPPSPGPIPRVKEIKTPAKAPKLKTRGFSIAKPADAGKRIARAERAEAYRPGKLAGKVTRALDIG